MSDLIERLRAYDPLATLEAANEIERLNEALIYERRLCTESIEERNALKRENEELRRRIRMLETANGTYAGIEKELAALKAQSTEPVAWIHYSHGGKVQVTTEKPSWPEDVWPPLYLHPPTATALVEDFRKRAVELCMNKAESVTQLNYAGGCEWCSEAIKSLPLIGEK